MTRRVTYTPQSRNDANAAPMLVVTKYARIVGVAIRQSGLDSKGNPVCIAIHNATKGVKPNSRVQIVLTREQAQLYKSAELAIREVSKRAREEAEVISGYETGDRAGALMRERAEVNDPVDGEMVRGSDLTAEQKLCGDCGSAVAVGEGFLYWPVRCWSCAADARER
jgi:hypothetical protein